MPKKVSTGVLHELPNDLKKALQTSESALELWEEITPIARNEFICWVTSPKKPETRVERIRRTIEELNKGKKRPCCWPGCPHRRESAKKWFK